LKATTKPTSRPATTRSVVLARRKGPSLPIGIAAPSPNLTSTKAGDAKTQATSAPSAQATSAPATQASTAPAATRSTTQASTAPTTAPTTLASTQPATQPSTKWELVEGDARKPADDSKVDQLLTQLHPLRVEKYLENPPTTQPTASYVISITTEGPGGSPVDKYEIRVVDPGNGQPLRGDYNGLAFEAARTLVDRFSGDFNKRAGASASPAASESPDALPNEQIPESIGP